MTTQLASRRSCTIAAFCATLLHACGGGSDGGDGGDADVAAVGPDSAAFVGLYDGTVDYGRDGVDVVYVDFDAEGFVTVYDYLGDSFDNGPNCHEISTRVEVVALGDDRYRIGNEESVITRSGENVLVTTQEPSTGVDGITTIVPVTQVLTPLAGVDPIDLTACV